jgi:hypothetical protein
MTHTHTHSPRHTHNYHCVTEGGRFDVSHATTDTMRPLTIFHVFDWCMKNVLHNLDKLEFQ